MNIVGIIPARMASTRFPGKPLVDICGMPMLGHVYFRSKMAKILNSVYIATCDSDIKKYGDSIGAETVMTLDTHKRATDRTAEAMEKIEKKTSKKIDAVIMIQGDEPMLMPEMINSVAEPLLKDNSVSVVNLMAELKDKKDQTDPNAVKVVTDKNSYALYF